MLRPLLFAILFLVTSSLIEKCYAQSKQIDSLTKKLYSLKGNNEVIDSIKCNIYSSLSEISPDGVWERYNDTLFKLSDDLLGIYKDSNSQRIFKKYKAIALNNKSEYEGFNGNYKLALSFQKGSLKLRREIGNNKAVAQSLGNLANLYSAMGDDNEAIKLHLEALEIRRKTGDLKSIANSLNNLGAIHMQNGSLDKGWKYYSECDSIFKLLGSTKSYPVFLSNMAYSLMKLAEKQGVSMEKPREYFKKSLDLHLKGGDVAGSAVVLNNLAITYMIEKNYEKVIYFSQKALDASLKSKNIKAELRSRNILYKAYKAIGQFKQAIENYSMFIQINDTLKSESNKKALIRSQLHHEFEKMAAADSVAHAKESEVKNAELAKQSAEIKAKKNQQYALFGGLALVMIFAGFMYNRFKVTQKQKGIIENQKEIVEEQKKLVEEKQKEILDSIHYAKRIQMAQVPNEKRVQSMLSKLKK
ncbi:MAG: tetratricopeptide repeat protein [Sphingobacteriaceae bacterium]|nr:tetratricopeptide repeat protein [Sphingobacteriaceae bacterium]